MGLFGPNKDQRDELEYARKITPVYLEACKLADIEPLDPVAEVQRRQMGDRVYHFEDARLYFILMSCVEILNTKTLDGGTAHLLVEHCPAIHLSAMWVDICLEAIPHFLDSCAFEFTSGFAVYETPVLHVNTWSLENLLSHGLPEYFPRMMALLDKLPQEKKKLAASKICEWYVNYITQYNHPRALRRVYESDGEFGCVLWLAIRMNFEPMLAEALKHALYPQQYIVLLTHMGKLGDVEAYLKEHRHIAALVDLLIDQKRYAEAMDILTSAGKENYGGWEGTAYELKMMQVEGLLRLQNKHNLQSEAVKNADEMLKYGEITQAEYEQMKRKATAKRFCTKCGEPLDPSFRFCPSCATPQTPPSTP